MADLKWIDDRDKVERYLRNSAIKTQFLNYWDTSNVLGETIAEINGKLTQNVDKKQIAELLLRREDAVNRPERLFNAVEQSKRL